MANGIIEISTWGYTGTLPTANSLSTTCSFNFTIDSTTRGKSFHDYITINKLYGTYKVGYLTFTFSGSTNLNVRVVNGSITKTGQIGNNNTYVQWVNYNHNDGDPSDEFYSGYNNFYIDIPSSGPGGGGTITIKWNAVSRELVEGTNYTINNYVYDGNYHYGLTGLSHCSATQTAQMNVGTYQETMYADNGTTQFVDCWYFIDTSTNEPAPQKTISWSITASTDKYVRIYSNGEWKRYVPYIYTNGSWHKAVAYVYTNNQWKEVNS